MQLILCQTEAYLMQLILCQTEAYLMQLILCQTEAYLMQLILMPNLSLPHAANFYAKLKLTSCS